MTGIVPEADSGEARSLMGRHLVWDNHGCMPIRPMDESFLPQLERYRAAGANVVTLNVAWDGMPADIGVLMLATFRRWLSERPSQYLQVETVQDLDAAKAAGRLGVLFDIEGGCALRGHLPMVELYYDLGVRWMLLAYNIGNELGGGCLDAADSGLTAFGRAVVDEMCRVGMIPCCSHAGYRTARDVMERSTLPVIFSHSNALGVWSHRRNIPDDLIRECARGGGVVGVNGCGIFLNPNRSEVDALVEQVCYIADLVGPNHVGLGLDYVFDGNELAQVRRTAANRLPAAAGYVDDPPTIQPERLPEIVLGLLHRGWNEESIGGFLGGNLRRVARLSWKSKAQHPTTWPFLG